MLDLFSHIPSANYGFSDPKTAELLEDPLKEGLARDIR
jgi:hypothetical protein